MVGGDVGGRKYKKYGSNDYRLAVRELIFAEN
jgi:hypothetical protein